jgi:hypothetical protein
VGRAFAGTVARTGCTRRTSVTDLIAPLALGLDLEPIATRLVDALAAVGRGDANLKQNLGVLNQSIV